MSGLPIIHVDLTFRGGDVRVAATNSVTIRSVLDFLGTNLIDEVIADLTKQLRPHVETMIETMARPRQDKDGKQ